MRLPVRLAAVATGCALLVAAVETRPLDAHGFGERYDLPVPLWLYIVGAGAAVAFSFVVIGLFVRSAPGLHDYPRLNLLRWRAGRALVHRAAILEIPWVGLPIQIASVALFVLVIVAGLFGDASPLENIAPTMVWVIWWVGMAYVSALIGDVWAFINPWTIIFDWADRLYQRVDREGELSLRYRYPQELGAWPGVLLFLAFAWAEIAYGGNDIPARIAQMALVYSFVTWGGMLLYGKEQWLRHGEAFSLVFGFLARFAPTEIRVVSTEVCRACPVRCLDRDGQCIGCAHCFSAAPNEERELNLRPFAAGLLRNEDISPSMLAFVVVLLSTVTFDGFTETPLWSDIQISLYRSLPSVTAIGTVGLLVFPLLFLGVYLGIAALMAAVSGNRLAGIDMARGFVYSLIPIALAYHLAHFFTLLLIQGQLIIPLASDPLGWGWDIFGTASYERNIGIVNARFAWFTAVGAIVIGHIVAVYLAHAIALRVLNERRPALRSQYPMLALMLGYTMVSLWILAQPIVETAPKG